MNSKRNTRANTRQSEHHSANSVHDQDPAPQPNFVTRQDLDDFAATITSRFQESLQQAVRTLPTILKPQQQNLLHSAQRRGGSNTTYQREAPDFWVEDIAESQESPLQGDPGQRGQPTWGMPNPTQHNSRLPPEPTRPAPSHVQEQAPSRMPEQSRSSRFDARQIINRRKKEQDVRTQLNSRRQGKDPTEESYHSPVYQERYDYAQEGYL